MSKDLINSINSFFQNRSTFVSEKFKNRIFVYGVALIGLTLDNLNVSGSITTVFSIAESFNASTTVVSWVLSSYALTIGAFIIIAGKFCDVLGAANVFLFGLFALSISALITAVIDKQIIALIVFRAIQGIFSAVLIPSSFAITSTYFQDPKELELATKFLITALVVSQGIGTVLGGAFSESNIGYKGLYYFSFAVGFSSFLILFFTMDPLEKTQEHSNLKLKNLDYGGSIFLVIGLILVILGLTEGGENWKRPVAYVPIIVGGLVCIGVMIFEMVYIQRYKDKYQIIEQTQNLESLKGSEKKEIGNEEELTIKLDKVDWRVNLDLLFPVEILSIPNFLVYCSSTFLIYIAFISILANLINYHIYVEGESPILASVKTLPFTAGLVFNTIIYKENITYKIGLKKSLIMSPLFSTGLIVWISRLDFRKSNSFWIFEFIPQFLAGITMNQYFQIYWNAILSGTPLHLQGLIAGILQTAGQIGVSIGNAIIASISGELIVATNYDQQVELHEKFRDVFYLAIAAMGLMTIVMLFVKNVERQKRQGSTSTSSTDTSKTIESETI
ncbi:hypothetical protein WICMUC_004204 [Wickerhamomyces mucosus]|uniref:Major facilitator superfamily (MFS) profile domain-containing protein n=1 Tax=Wickerhamomyces mucosus TaxID=1378264 RepID=A0A9P8PIJ3_9ASCO|nr:hypothetical protein WICMUC_004204 [Wickerhamomyces mucosus]